MNKGKPADDRGIFTETEANIRERLWRAIAGEPRSCFCRVSDQTRAASEQRDNYREGGTRMSEHLNGKQRAADRADDGVDGVPGRVDPWNLVRKKFEEIKDARDDDNRWIAEDF